MKILLHTCCAPCLVYPLEHLSRKGIEVLPFFYNPNIYPMIEFQKRRQALVDFANKVNLDVAYPGYIPSEFNFAIGDKTVAPERCLSCWKLRLKATARAAREQGINYFSTTLLVSPYQNQDELRRLGEEAMKEEEGSIFYYEDFRPGFKKAHDKARALGLYCQKYCGCAFSEMEQSRK
ncbi:MAG: epoxyqueuosine reductase QueH [Candidatus Omnitrophica bacterium]|nr:epoxyqueuosine reductase QueH [Candidatus Omnitrophota bacterium]